LKISVYSDGSSSGRSGEATGWGYVIVKNDDEVFCCGYGGAPDGTNNTAELEAAIQGLTSVACQNLHVENSIELVSDSQYVLGLGDGTYSPKKNVSQAMELRALVKKTGATVRWVRGHSGNPVNEQCDKLAKLGKEMYSASGSKGVSNEKS
jgi:ribonuclease HI